MSDKELWAVHLDCGLSKKCEWHAQFAPGKCLHTTPLGGSIGVKNFARNFFEEMVPGDVRGYDEERNMWEVDEDDLPFGYTFQTYYIARYEVES